MAGEFNVDKERLQGIAQGLLDIKQRARTIENTAEAFIPLTGSTDVERELNLMMDASAEIAAKASVLYRLIAKEAMTNA